MPRAQKGERFGGRTKGTPNKITKTLKDAIIESFNKVGGVNYLITVAHDDPKSYCTLLGKTMPMDIKTDINMRVELGLADRIAEARSRANTRV